MEELILNVTVFFVRVWGGQYREELICESYCVCCECLGGQYREDLILNITVFVVRIWGVQYREELIQNVTVFV